MLWQRVIDEGAFDPETVELLCAAVDAAFAQVEERGTVIDREACRNILARRVVELAKTGERSPQRLVDHAVAAFTP